MSSMHGTSYYLRHVSRHPLIPFAAWMQKREATYMNQESRMLEGPIANGDFRWTLRHMYLLDLNKGDE